MGVTIGTTTIVLYIDTYIYLNSTNLQASILPFVKICAHACSTALVQAIKASIKLYSYGPLHINNDRNSC